jgi:hypothetical protein
MITIAERLDGKQLAAVLRIKTLWLCIVAR